METNKKELSHGGFPHTILNADSSHGTAGYSSLYLKFRNVA